MILHNGDELIELSGAGDAERHGKKVGDGRIYLSVCACISETANENTDAWFSREFTGSVEAGKSANELRGQCRDAPACVCVSAPDQTACRNHLSEGEQMSERKG